MPSARKLPMKEPSATTWWLFVQKLKAKADRFRELGPPLVRVSLGVMFAQSGLGKLMNLERTAGFFESLGIPAPALHAFVVGNVELVCGIAIALGLLARLAAIPLAITMLVAIATALLPDVQGALDLIALSETLYLAVLVLLITQGPGRWSIDSFLQRWISGRSDASSCSLTAEPTTPPLHPLGG